MPIVYSISVFLGEYRMSQTWNLQQVQQHYQQCKEQLPDPVRLRIHRSFSWLKQAAANPSEDLQFMCLWVAFNAAYAKDLQNHDKPSESEEFRHFLQQICKADNQDIYQLIWQTYSASIRTLLDSQYVFQPYWDHKNGMKSEQSWQDSFDKARRKSHLALADKNTPLVLSIVFSRLYTLRNQVFHGGATFASTVNRAQLKDAIRILTDVLPLFLYVMMSHPNEAVWGKPYYPPIKD